MQTKQQLIEFLGAKSRLVHFIGIGGCGMSGLARLLIQQGHHVTGSDMSPNGETTSLRKLGARIHTGHAARHLHPDTELVVYTPAVSVENEELQAAAELKIPSIRRGRLLTALMTHRSNIAVAGTHGKTTTSAMIAFVLTRSDSAPSFCVGANVPVLGTNAQIGGGNYFVAEADESDGTLIGFTPEYAVCLNIEPEHLDYHRSMDQLMATFDTFLTSALKTVFYCADCTNCTTLAKTLRTAISFGLSERADYRALDIQPTTRGSRFAVVCRDQKIGEVELIIPGQQNIINALAAVAVADELGMPFNKVAEALGQFSGAKRRFERVFEADGLVVVNDYAHHPTEVRATIAAARSLGHKRLLVAFQPHRYTRVQALRDQFGCAFAGADRLFLTDIYAASEQPIDGVNGYTLIDAVHAAGQKDVIYEPNLDRLAKHLAAEARPGDLLLVMGAGDIYKVAQKVGEILATRKPIIAEQPMRIDVDLRSLLSDKAVIRMGEPMARHTSLRVGGPAELWIEPWNERDLTKLLRFCHRREIPVTMVGRGTNLLVRDGGIAGVVVHLSRSEFSKIEVDGEYLIVCGGARLRSIVNTARKHQLGGLEFLEGIPGSLGGALRMNAGAMGKQTLDVVGSVRYVSCAGEVYDAEARTLPVSYRSCPLFTSHVVLQAVLRGEKCPRAEIDARLRQFEKKRWSSQPARPSAGCIWKNPEEIPAGRLIDELGLKGASVGGARISDVHGNFIVNEGGAKASDVLKLMAMIRERAQQERGIALEPEVMILGRDE
jgi:UDP-N-acetylmuramate--alanine ligase